MIHISTGQLVHRATPVRHESRRNSYAGEVILGVGSRSRTTRHTRRVAHSHERNAEFATLVDDERLDDLLAVVTLDEIAEAWHCYHRREANSYDDPDWWAIE